MAPMVASSTVWSKSFTSRTNSNLSFNTLEFRYFAKNFDWLIEQLDEDEDDDYVIIDCPGQIELYTHLPTMKQLVDQLVILFPYHLNR